MREEKKAEKGGAFKEEVVDIGKKITFDWYSYGATVERTTSEVYSGVIQRAIFIPQDVEGEYEVTVKDKDGVDVLVGGGARLSHETAVQLTPATTTSISTVVSNTKLTFAVTGNGEGRVIIYISG